MPQRDTLPRRIVVILLTMVCATVALLGLQLWWGHASAGLVRALDPRAPVPLLQIEAELARLERALDRSGPQDVHHAAQAGSLELLARLDRLRAQVRADRLPMTRAQLAEIERGAAWLAAVLDDGPSEPADIVDARLAVAALSEPVTAALDEARARALAGAVRLERRGASAQAATAVLASVSLVAGALLVFTLRSDFRQRERRLVAAEVAHAKACHEAAHDPLTGLPNRRCLGRDITRRLADAGRPQGNPFALHLVDLDDLKGLNDGHGHAAGDRVLEAVGRALACSVRRSDFVARIGGDEFVVVQHDASTAQAEAMVHRLVDRVRRPVRLADGTIVVPSASVGVSRYGEDGTTCEALLEAADRRLYASKRSGRSSQVWRPLRAVTASAG